MSLDLIIPPEITCDSFYSTLKDITAHKELKTFLEIGSSSGAGSTKALVEGLSTRVDSPKLFCMELSRERYIALYNSYKEHPFIYTYNLSSLPASAFPSEDEVRYFYDHVESNLRAYDIDTVIDWLRQDRDYLQKHGLDFNGINFIKKCHNIETFDFVLIDGSEFLGEVELQSVWKSKVIALDDIKTFKNYASYSRLKASFSYKLIQEDLTLRHGYAIFERTYNI